MNQLLFSAFVLGTTGWLVYTRYFHPLSRIPGPFLASVTRLWYVRQVQKGSYHEVNRNLHRPIVRVSPNEVSVSDPEAIAVIYSIKSKFVKTEFYPPWTPDDAFKTKHADHFSDIDETHHSQRRRLVNHIYSMTNVLESEPYMDSCIQDLLDKLDGFAESEESVDLGSWLQMYAFDIIGELYFGSSFGFIRSSSDYGNWIATTDRLMPIILTVANLPVMFRPFYIMSGLLYPSIRRAIGDLGGIAKTAKMKVKEREDLMQSTGSQVPNGRNDILSKLFALKREKGETHDYNIADIELAGAGGLLAGSDTTSVALRAVMYQLLTHPAIYQNVMRELEEAQKSGRLTVPTKYADAIKLPYFVACVKEAMRLHPSVGLPLPRRVPKEGCKVADTFIPGGVNVAMNAAVVHYDKSVFGDDAEVYNPDRWLQEGASKMDRYMLTFGGGTRTCIGKNISLAEIHKMLPALLLRFKVELVDPSKPLKTHNYWFHKQEGLIVKLSYRK